MKRSALKEIGAVKLDNDVLVEVLATETVNGVEILETEGWTRFHYTVLIPWSVGEQAHLNRPGLLMEVGAMVAQEIEDSKGL